MAPERGKEPFEDELEETDRVLSVSRFYPRQGHAPLFSAGPVDEHGAIRQRDAPAIIDFNEFHVDDEASRRIRK